MVDLDAKQTQERDVLEDPGWDIEPLAAPQFWMKPPSFSDKGIVGTVIGGIGIATALVGLHWLLRKFT